MSAEVKDQLGLNLSDPFGMKSLGIPSYIFPSSLWTTSFSPDIFSPSAAPLFAAKHPVTEMLYAIKLTKGNIADIAKAMIADDQILAVSDADIFVNGVTLRVGSWVVKDYDYETEKNAYRPPTLEERKRYALR